MRWFLSPKIRSMAVLVYSHILIGVLIICSRSLAIANFSVSVLISMRDCLLFRLNSRCWNRLKWQFPISLVVSKVSRSVRQWMSQNRLQVPVYTTNKQLIALGTIYFNPGCFRVFNNQIHSMFAGNIIAYINCRATASFTASVISR